MDNLISKSEMMTSEALNSLQRNYFEWAKLKVDVELAEEAGLPVSQSSQQIQERMNALKKVINTYATTNFNP